MSVNVVIRSTLPKTNIKENFEKSMRGYLNYLHREESLYMRYSSTDYTDVQFARVFGDRGHYRVIVSPALSCDMKELLEKTIDGIEKFNRIRKVDYVAYLHKDTEHPHLHIIVSIPKKSNKKKPFTLSAKFVEHYLYPYVNNYLNEIFGVETEEEEKRAYALSVNNQGQSMIDYDIKRNCDIKGKYLVYNEEKEKKKTPLWKVPFIKQRIKILQENELCAYIKDKFVFLKDFIYRKILLGKLQYHKNKLNGIKMSDIKPYNVSKKNLKRILSIEEFRNTTSYVVENLQDEICYFETKKRT